MSWVTGTSGCRRNRQKKKQESRYVGNDFFDATNVTLATQADCTADSRERFINFCFQGALR
eukprot:12049362-Prorocentrum_lima.AAC.1